MDSPSTATVDRSEKAAMGGERSSEDECVLLSMRAETCKGCCDLLSLLQGAEEESRRKEHALQQACSSVVSGEWAMQ